MIGLGTIINVIAILVGSAIGVALGHRLPQRTRDVVTDGLGLITLLVAALSAAFGERCHPGHAGLRCQYGAG